MIDHYFPTLFSLFLPFSLRPSCFLITYRFSASARNFLIPSPFVCITGKAQSLELFSKTRLEALMKICFDIKIPSKTSQKCILPFYEIFLGNIINYGRVLTGINSKKLRLNVYKLIILTVLLLFAKGVLLEKFSTEHSLTWNLKIKKISDCVGWIL